MNQSLVVFKTHVHSFCTHCASRGISIIPLIIQIVPNMRSLLICPSRLAESRTNPQVLDIGVNPQDLNTEECLSPGKWDQEDTDFTAQKDTFGF